MTPQQITRVEATIKKGKTRYVVLNGVIGWGLLTATLFVTWKYLTNSRIDYRDIIIPFIIFPIAGMLWGLSMWYHLKRRFDSP